MDPNANLQEQLELIHHILDQDDVDPDDATRLAELQLALSAWLSTGGFLPRLWMKGR